MTNKSTSLKKLINEYVAQTLGSEENLNESLRITEMVKLCGGKEAKFGSKEHIDDLQRTLEGLYSLRDQWERGSSSRYMVASTCHRLKRLLAKLMANQDEVM